MSDTGSAEDKAAQAETQRHFSPYDLTDGRERYDWETRWPRKAQIFIASEAVSLFVVAIATPFLLLLTWNGDVANWFDIPADDAPIFERYALAWLGGLLGGASFSLKWLYHSVAKGSWHQDRLLWRFSTPLLSAGLAFAVTALVRSGLFPLLDSNALRSASSVVAFAFLTGYFSDHAIGALLRLAQRIFGETRKNVGQPGQHTH